MIRGCDKESTIRCGVLQRSSGTQCLPTFLAALLADVYASDQTWLVTLLNRQGSPMKSPLLVQYGEHFEAHEDKNCTKFNVPSPFLKKHRIEFLEILSPEVRSDDECHFYIDLSDGSPTKLYRWPTVSVSDTSSLDPLPFSNQINSSRAVKAILKFIRDKSSVESYLEDIEKSNVANFAERVKHKIDDRKQIFSELGRAVLENVSETDKSLAKHLSSEARKQEMIADIEVWRRQAHEELQNKVMPVLRKFLKDHLTVRNIYLYSEDKFSLRLKEMVDQPLHNLQMVKHLYSLKGKLGVEDSSNSSLYDTKSFNEELTLAHKNLNKVVYQNFFQIQLPLILCSTVGYISEQFSLYSMGSLASLGVILGVQKVIYNWEAASKKTINKIYHAIRSSIESEGNSLIQQCNAKFKSDEIKNQRKQEIIDSLFQDLKT